MTADGNRLALVDVSMRDGLQDEAVFVDTDEKLRIAAALASAGVRQIEVTSFVHPAWVPQLADADVLVPQLPHGPRYSVLTLNRRGWDRAVAAFDAAGIRRGDYDVVFVTSASERHALANNNRTIDQTLLAFDEIANASRAAGVTLRATIACAFVSPWSDEPIDPDRVVAIVRRFVDAGAGAVTVADTVGNADPVTVARRLARIRADVPDARLAIHLHDAAGYGLANVYAALENGVRAFEGALAGLGGCPFAPGAEGNIDLIKLAGFVRACGFDPGVDERALAAVAATIRRALSDARPIAAA